MGLSCVEVLVPTSTSDTGRRAMIQSNKSISPLRQRMIEDMSLRKLSVKTQTAYIRAVVKLTRFLGRSPDTATAEDLRLFQLDMSETGFATSTRRFPHSMVSATKASDQTTKTADQPSRLMLSPGQGQLVGITGDPNDFF